MIWPRSADLKFGFVRLFFSAGTVFFSHNNSARTVFLAKFSQTNGAKRKKGKAGACAIKLDMAKAYDRVEWDYLRGIMLKLGFHHEFVELIMRCVTTVSFSIKVNGLLTEVFRPTRGIRQGDPSHPTCFSYARKDYHVC